MQIPNPLLVGSVCAHCVRVKKCGMRPGVHVHVHVSIEGVSVCVHACVCGAATLLVGEKEVRKAVV